MTKLFLTLFLLLSAACATSAAKPTASIDGLDVFGSKRISLGELRAQFGAAIVEWVHAMKSARPDAFELKTKIKEAIKIRYGLAYVGLSLITYFAPQPGDYVTVDVVEPADLAERMAFDPEPTGRRFDDPDGLIALWDQYEQLIFELLHDGHFEYPKSCPAWHCTLGFEHPRLAPFGEKFSTLVPKNEKKLVQILRLDERAQFRGNAAFLLAHIGGGKAVVRYELGSVRDPSSLVRNNALRVLSEIANQRPELEIPVHPILQALNFPDATDRNKAGYTLAALSKKAKNKDPIVRKVGWTLIEMLKLQQPNNHDPAYQILRNVSGETFGDRDYQSWENWLCAINPET